MYEFPLTGAQRSHLRGLGQKLDPVLKVGREGLSPEFLKELQKALRAHELVKLRFLGVDRDERDVKCAEIADQGRCVCVGTVGHTALFYRQNSNPKERSVVLPGT
jgi:RNA-binding protein